MTESKKLIVVLAATGSQGSAVINHFLTHHRNTYRIRGTTRNLSSPKAQALASKGVEMIQADLSDPSSLTRAFDGASFIYAYTDSAGCAQAKEAIEAFESRRQPSLTDAAGALEVQQGKNIADAAAKVESLEKLIWSSTPDPTGVKGGKYYNYEMASKAEIGRYMHSLPGLKGKVNSVYLAVFVESFVRFPQVIGWTKLGYKKYAVRVPWNLKSAIPWLDLASDAGSWMEALIGVEGGITVEAMGGEMSTEDIVTVMGRSLGVEIEVQQVAMEEYVGGDQTGLMEHVGRLMMWTADLGIGREDPAAIEAGEFAKAHPFVKRSDIREAFENIDWSSML